MVLARKLIGILEQLEQLERSSFLRGFSSAEMPLFSKALHFQGCPPL